MTSGRVDLEAALEEWRRQRPLYRRLGERVESELKRAVRALGISGEITHRVKDETSLLKKLLGRSMRLDELTDRVGARVVVLYEASVERVGHVIREEFRVVKEDDKRERYEPFRVGYLGWHFDVSLREDRVQSGDEDLLGLLCEVQVNTKAQRAWADASHDLLYKMPEDAVPPGIARSVNRLMALVELFDQEIERARSVMLNLPDAEVIRVLDALETHYYRLSGKRADPGLSRKILAAVMTLVPEEERTTLTAAIEEFVQGQRERLVDLFEQYSGDDRILLLSQPESVLLIYLLETRGFELVERWQSVLPVEILAGLAEAWGRPIGNLMPE